MVWIIPLTDGPRTEMLETKPCIGCGGSSLLRLNPDDVLRWLEGAFVQDVWAQFDADRRELIMTGTHPFCWDEMFGDDDEYEPSVATLGMRHAFGAWVVSKQGRSWFEYRDAQAVIDGEGR